MALIDALAGLPVAIDGYALHRLRQPVPGFTRVSTVVTVHGAGATGAGEDVSYLPEDQDTFPAGLPLRGRWTFGEASQALGEMDLFPAAPGQEAAVDYRLWALESAVLDLALRQAGLSLGAALGRRYRSVRFVASPRGDGVEEWL
ncbi:MAG: hypothetical protein AB1416_10600, partial [Actinomycetota bacterium]